MTEAEILQMANQAGIHVAVMASEYSLSALTYRERRDLDAITRFANLVAERAKAVKVDMEPVGWMDAKGFFVSKTTHPHLYTPVYTATQLAQAVAERDAVYEKEWADLHAAVGFERERCAKVCESKVDAEIATGKVDHNEIPWTTACAIAIRRGE